MVIENDGDVGIGGMTKPQFKLHVKDDEENVTIIGEKGETKGGLEVTDNEVRLIAKSEVPLQFRAGGEIDHFTIDTNGNVSGTHGDYHPPSDHRLKKDVETIPDALGKVNALREVNFRWTDPEKDQDMKMGLIAQEVETVVPEVVHTANDHMNTKSVEYPFLAGLFVEAIKELNALHDEEIAFLQEQIDELKLQNHRLQGKLNQIE